MTNQSKLGDTGKKTGWYLPEVAHPHQVLTAAGFEIVYVSPKGGESPMDPGSADAFKEDPVCQAFLKNNAELFKLDSTLTPDEVKDQLPEFKALFYPGGHGPMYDIASAENVAKLAAQIYESGGVLGAVCHGTVGFMPIKISGEPLVKGKKVTSFTDTEEKAVQLDKVMPFLLETELRKQGAEFVGAADWASNVQVDGRLVSGQNPASASDTAKALVKLLS